MLTTTRKEEIENLANSIIRKYNIIECPAKFMHSIMEKEGILYFENSIDDINFDGLLTKNNDGKFYAQTEGTYYIKYTVSNIKYGSIFKVQKIRLIHFVEPTESEELGGANA